MIVEALFLPIFLIVRGLIALLPGAFTLPLWSVDTFNLLLKALFFFPADVWVVIIGNISFWLIAQFSWSIIEWIYKKIPGVD